MLKFPTFFMLKIFTLLFFISLHQFFEVLHRRPTLLKGLRCRQKFYNTK